MCQESHTQTKSGRHKTQKSNGHSGLPNSKIKRRSSFMALNFLLNCTLNLKSWPRLITRFSRVSYTDALVISNSLVRWAVVLASTSRSTFFTRRSSGPEEGNLFYIFSECIIRIYKRYFPKFIWYGKKLYSRTQKIFKN